MIRLEKLLQEILAYNREFVHNKEYIKYQTDKFPDKRLVIVSCMDTRLTELLPRALNLRNGDVKMIKDAGAIVAHPFGSVMRSIIVAIYELGAEEVMVIGHHGCGMGSINPSDTMEKFKQRGITEDTIATLNYAGIDLDRWLHGFASVHDSVRNSVNIIRQHPLIPKDVVVHGLVIDPESGELEVVVNGSEESA
jgi:carbonic anhydrase